MLNEVSFVHNNVYFGGLFALLKYFGLLVVPLGPVEEAGNEHFVAILEAEHDLGKDGDLVEDEVAVETQTVIVVDLVVEVVDVQAETALEFFGFHVRFQVEQARETKKELEKVSALQKEVKLAKIVVRVARSF